jgi:hypothetical protein
VKLLQNARKQSYKLCHCVSSSSLQPTLVAVSKQVAFKNPKAPVFPRLAQGKTHDEMTVTWTSGYDISEAYPFVEWCVVTSGSGNPTRTPAGTLTFNRGSMCGTYARRCGL